MHGFVAGLQPHPRQPSRPVPVFHVLMWASGEDKVRDWMLEAVSWTGFLMAVCLAIQPARTFLLPLLLWATYLSIVNLESGVINYGWEWLTLELGFLTVFLAPPTWWSASSTTRSAVDAHSTTIPPAGVALPAHDPPPVIVVWLFRWCAFRLLIGAGMSKLGTASSDCWTELTCTETHYVTQPMPTPLAWWAHHAPFWFHRCVSARCP